MQQTTSTAASLESAFLQEIGMPAMNLSHKERIQQLMATRNEWKLYHRKCDATGEKILSAYPANSPYKVYKNEVWWGDSWEALDYGKEYDFSRPFFDQFYELQLAVPREGTSVFDSENCDYNSHVRYSKNCYLNSLLGRGEDIYYSCWMVDVEDTIDSGFHIKGKSSLCYECLDFSTCYQCIAMKDAYNCNDCFFSLQLRGCDHCILCSNLTQKSYHIKNKPCTKEEFEKLKSEMINGSHESFAKAMTQWKDMRDSAIHRESNLINCENVTGDHIFDSKNCLNCFDGDGSEDCSNTASLNDNKDVHSCYSAGWPACEQLWNCCTSRGCIDMAFCRYMWFSNDMRYCDSCQTCKHCIGCTGLRHKDYCILNKQYTKEEYEELAPKVIEHMKSTGEWGSFWPYEHLPFAYNESAAMDYFPMKKEDAISLGYRWKDTKEEVPDVEKIIDADKLPDAIADVPDDILNWAIRCANTGKAFRIIKKELDFYRRMKLPIPRICPDERLKKRMNMRNPYLLFDRKCAKCTKEIRTSYSSEREEAVYCEECYLKEVY